MHLLDACTISAHLHRDAPRRTPRLVARVEEVVRADGGARIAEITAYEIRRGLRLLELRGASGTKRRRTELFLRQSTILSIGPAFPVAIDLWARAQLLKPAVSFSEADLLTVSCAIANGLVLLTSDAKLVRALGRVGAQGSVEQAGLR